MRKPVFTLDRYHFIRGTKVGEEELNQMKQTLRFSCLTVLRLTKVTLTEYNWISEVTKKQFFYIEYCGFYYIIGRPASREEGKKVFLDLSDGEHVIKLAVSGNRTATTLSGRLIPSFS